MKIESVLFSDDLRKLIRYPENRNGDTYSVPDGIEEIADSAFSHHHLKKIVIPDSIETIGAHAFATKNEKIFLIVFFACICQILLVFLPRYFSFV